MGQHLADLSLKAIDKFEATPEIVLLNNAKKLCEESNELQKEENRLRTLLFKIQQQHNSKVNHMNHIAQETTEALKKAQQITDEMEAKKAEATTFNPNDYEDELSNRPKIELLDGSCLFDRLTEIMEKGKGLIPNVRARFHKTENV